MRVIKSRNFKYILAISLSLALALTLITISKPAEKNAGTESKAAGASKAKEEIAKAIEKGKALFNDTKLGNTGSSCNTCHPGGGTSGGTVMGMAVPSLKKSGATFPKYKEPAKKVITLQQMNNMCIQMIMEGTPLMLDSDDSVALAAYVTSLSNGTKVKVGGK